MEKKIVDRYRNIKIQPFHTFLIEQTIQICEKIMVSILEGTAQIFGLELKANYPHQYWVPCSLPIFTWDGCEVSIEWSEMEGTMNSERDWQDITELNEKEYYNRMRTVANTQQYHNPILDYFQIHYKLIGERKLALQQNKSGPVVAVVSSEESAPHNITKLLLNYSGKFNMDPIFIDLDPKSSTMFVDGTMGALEFQYKIIEDLYDRPNKITFYYGNRHIHPPSYKQLVTLICNSTRQKLNKQMKEFKDHGSFQQYPYFSSGMVIQCPRIRKKHSKSEQYQIINWILELFGVTHTICVEADDFSAQIPENLCPYKFTTRPLEGTKSFLNLPRPIKSKIQRYFNGQAKKKVYPIDSITIYELKSGSLKDNTSQKCRIVNIREEAVSKNVVAILHAKLSEGESLNLESVARKALLSPICCLTHIYGIGEEEVTFEVTHDSFLEDFSNNIWMTSVSDQ